ncbi:cation diffusion facilitator family transporter [Vallitaleaceae bacterium 9-2]
MNNRNSNIHYVAISGMIGNIFLLIIKLIVGLMSHSQAMIADGLNSAGDVFASLMTYIGNKISSQPYDEEHPYGHGKAEYIFSMLISISLFIVAFNIVKSSIDSLTNHTAFLFTPWLIVVAFLTIIIKLSLYFYSNHIGHKYNSLLAFANAEDHRNDVFITSFTLLSIITAYFELYFIDSIVGVAIGIWIAYTGLSIFSSAYYVLMDTTIDQDIKDELFELIGNIDGVDHVDTITSKPIGLNFLLIVKISVDGNLSIIKGHQIGDQVKQKLLNYNYVDEVIVHLNATQIHPQKEYIK